MAKTIAEFRSDLVHEMNELIRIGVNVPSKAIKLAKGADPKNFQGMSSWEVVDMLIMQSFVSRG
jgi:hypothetical protein